MVKKTLELYECDKCGQEAKRYTILYEDGSKVLDRCERHNKTLEALRNEPGEWLTPRSTGKSQFRKTSMDELRVAVEQGRQSKQDGT